MVVRSWFLDPGLDYNWPVIVISENAAGCDFPHRPGTYALFCSLEHEEQIEIGQLGSFFFASGIYVYVGSALGPGGLAGRLNRHLRRDHKVRRWHIDYLVARAPLVQVWYCQSPSRNEHIWAHHLANLPEVQIPAPHFGSSDCRCPAHLFYLGQMIPTAIGEGWGESDCHEPGLVVVEL